MRATHTWSDSHSEIAIEGITESVRLLHVTDAHITMLDQRDADREQSGDFDAWQRRFPDQIEPLQRQLRRAEALAVDIVALTGDIVHMPSQLAVESVAHATRQASAAALYTAGNHDWCWPGEPATAATRATFRPALEPLHGGNASHHRYEQGGVQFLTLDDSLYGFDEEQLAFVRQHLDGGQPAVILTHIPISLPTLRTRVIDRWTAPIVVGDPDWPPVSRRRFGVAPDSATTGALVDTLATAPNVVAVLCGHVHFAHADSLSRHAMQYVSAPAFDGQARLVELRPLDGSDGGDG